MSQENGDGANGNVEIRSYASCGRSTVPDGWLAPTGRRAAERLVAEMAGHEPSALNHTKHMAFVTLLAILSARSFSDILALLNIAFGPCRIL